jgi:phosphoribosyl-AMP cyclohydrolase
VLDELKWDGDGLIPAVVQETETGEVLMVAWMDREAMARTLETGLGHYWSRSRRALWRKGETSGHAQHVDGLYADWTATRCWSRRTGRRRTTGRYAFRTSRWHRWPGAGPAIPRSERVQSRKVERPSGSYRGLFERGNPDLPENR